MVAKDYEVLVWIKFLVSTSGDIAHGHRNGALDMRCSELPWLADIDEADLVLAKKKGCIGGGNLVIEHALSVEAWAHGARCPEPGLRPFRAGRASPRPI